jgi:hypothetical protein
MADRVFSATVDKWATATKARMLAVFKKSVEAVINRMQQPVGGGGNMPIDTGFLRKSLLATLNTPTTKVTFRGDDVRVDTWNSAQVTLVIFSAKIGDVIYAIYTANYAAYQEYGSQGRAGRGFVRLATQRWQSIVNLVVAQEKSKRGIK